MRFQIGWSVLICIAGLVEAIGVPFSVYMWTQDEELNSVMHAADLDNNGVAFPSYMYTHSMHCLAGD